MKYTNPILHFDFSDPDAIRVGNDFYMIASSFNYVPGLPILHSKNLVEWELIGYALDEIPFKEFDNVIHGGGVWAPALRYHDGIFYIIIPFPDNGIYVISTRDIRGKWSKPHCLIEGKGIIDPCPLWLGDKCYVAVGFAKSRIGFNSQIGICEVSTDLKTQLSDIKIVYDGHDNNPTIEGPKFNLRNGYIYIMAPAGSVKGGWQVALRSKNIYGPYESKVVLMQNGTKINGPHQGALIDIDDNDNWSFIHFQDKWAYGRIVHLEPVKWVNDWPLCGEVRDDLLAGSPVSEWECPLDIKTRNKIDLSDDFKNDKMSLLWQTQANRKPNWFYFDNGLVLNCVNDNIVKLDMLPNLLTQKIPSLEFEVELEVDISNLESGEFGFAFMGESYSYLSFKKEKETTVCNLIEGGFNTEEKLLKSNKLEEEILKIKLKAYNKDIYDLYYEYEVNEIKLPYLIKASAGRWTGATYGVFAKGNCGSAKVRYFNTKVLK